MCVPKFGGFFCLFLCDWFFVEFACDDDEDDDQLSVGLEDGGCETLSDINLNE